MSFGALLASSLGGSFLSTAGQIYANKKNREQADSSNYQQMAVNKNRVKMTVKDAQQAGIHPLYALGAPTMQAGSAVSQMGNPMADIGQAVQNLPQSSTSMDKQLQAMDFQSKHATLQNMNLQNDLLQQEYNANKLKMAHEAQTRARNSPDIVGKTFGKDIIKNQRWSDAQKIEDRYGDVASWLYGIGTLGADASRNLFPEYYKK